MPRIALGLEYDGSSFAGWQIQRDKRTVQACLERAVAKVAAESVDLVCAGRTDSGVHALEQVAHFDTGAQRDMRSWVLGVNTNLPDDVLVLWARPVPDEFHARSCAIARFYRYVILNRGMRSALRPRQATWCFYPLDAGRMQEAADHLIGDHDFSSFRAQGCQSNSPRRLMHLIRVWREDEEVIVEICANAFLHHMVRNIAGVLMAIGAGKRESDWTRELLELKNRSLAGITAPADGLYLAGVYYPERFGIPHHPLFELLPAGVDRYRPAAHQLPATG